MLFGVLRTFGWALRQSLAVALWVAAFLYVVFALQARATLPQLLVELAGVALYGAMAWWGMKRSMGWLIAGWALHPVWDVGLHALGPAAGIAPNWYAHACLGFDLVIAAGLLQSTSMSENGE